jgi:hypothetical protein
VKEKRTKSKEKIKNKKEQREKRAKRRKETDKKKGKKKSKKKKTRMLVIVDYFTNIKRGNTKELHTLSLFPSPLSLAAQ